VVNNPSTAGPSFSGAYPDVGQVEHRVGLVKKGKRKFKNPFKRRGY
jgi:hypothetical protein